MCDRITQVNAPIIREFQQKIITNRHDPFRTLNLLR